jgi:hypothetical protein
MNALEDCTVADDLEFVVDVAACRRAIADAYFEPEQRLDARHLWTRGRISFFRVNWWDVDARGASRIVRSAFVSIEHTDEGPQVRGQSPRAAKHAVAAGGEPEALIPGAARTRRARRPAPAQGQ